MKPYRMPQNIEQLAEHELAEQPYGGILTIAEYPILRELLPNCIEYVGVRWGAQRRIVDQLDQVTFWRL